MIPIKDKAGRHVGWLKDDTIYGYDHSRQGSVSSGSVFKEDGTRVGEFDDDFFRDREGLPVAYLASDPVECRVSVPGIIPTPIGMVPFPIRTVGVMRVWSRLRWDQYLSCEA